MSQKTASKGIIGLYQTFGKRASIHRCVLYIALDYDWGARQLDRNGNTGNALITSPMTDEAWSYRNESKRARCLRYNGKYPANDEGLKADLATLGYDEKTQQAFAEASKGCW